MENAISKYRFAYLSPLLYMLHMSANSKLCKKRKLFIQFYCYYVYILLGTDMVNGSIFHIMQTKLYYLANHRKMGFQMVLIEVYIKIYTDDWSLIEAGKRGDGEGVNIKVFRKKYFSFFNLVLNLHSTLKL